MSQNKGSPNKKKKYLLLLMDTLFYMILTYAILTIIDQKVIEFELLLFELCNFFAKAKKKISNGSLHSKHVTTATVSGSVVYPI